MADPDVYHPKKADTPCPFCRATGKMTKRTDKPKPDTAFDNTVINSKNGKNDEYD